MKKAIKLCIFSGMALSLFQGCNKQLNEEKAVRADVNASAIITGTYGSYYVTCVNGGKALEVGGFETLGDKQTNGRGIQQWQTPSANTPSKWQEWNAVDLGNGYYKIMNLYSGKVLDVPGSSTTPGVQLQQYQWNGTNAQQWSITSIGFGAYKITNRGNGLAATIENASTNNGAKLVQQPYANTGSQWFVFNSIPLDSYRDDEVTRYFQRTSGSTAFDGVTSCILSYGGNAGKVFWTTNDTYWNSINGDGSTNCLGNENQPIAERSSALLQPAKSGGVWNWAASGTANILSNQGRKVFVNNGTEWVWPSGCIEVGSHIYVYCDEGSGLSQTVESIHDLNQTGSGYTDTRLSIPSLNQTAIRYMHGMLKYTDAGVNYVYVYGADSWSNVYVARFPESNATQWTYWNGSTWAAAPSTAAAAKIASMPWGGFFVAKVNNKFVIISMDFGFTCDLTARNVYSSFSTNPKSGFSANKIVYTLPDFKQGHMPVYYAPAIHPQFDNGHNELLVTYCINFYNKNDGSGGTCLQACSNANGTMDPNDYRPKAIRIPYALIDPSL